MAQKGYISLWTEMTYEECKLGLIKFLHNNSLCSKCKGTGLKSQDVEYEIGEVGVQYENVDELTELKESCSNERDLKFSSILKKFIAVGLGFDKNKCKKCTGKGYYKK